MTLYDYILETFGVNEPIKISDISFNNYSRPWIYKEIKNLCNEGKLIRYEKGIYYAPTQTVFGPSLLNPRKVIEKKYITDGEKTIGYYSGLTFMNRLGLTAQMPNVIEIYTNNEPARMREVLVGKQRVVLRKSRTAINKSNVAVLSFLELMNSLPLGNLNSEKKKILTDYILKNNITRSEITKYVRVFPSKTVRALIESEVIYSVARG